MQQDKDPATDGVAVWPRAGGAGGCFPLPLPGKLLRMSVFFSPSNGFAVQQS